MSGISLAIRPKQARPVVLEAPCQGCGAPMRELASGVPGALQSVELVCTSCGLLHRGSIKPKELDA